MKKYFFPFVIALSLVFYYSCTKDKTSLAIPPDCSGVDSLSNTYTLHIKSILDNYCATPTCHDAASAQFAVDLSSYSSSVNAFQYKNVICSVKQNGCLPMPQGGRPLADSLITAMECWQSHNYPK